MKNFDVLQLSERIVSARQVDEVFAQKPEWDAGSRKRMNSLDHHNPKSWTGDTRIETVDLLQCWKNGEVDASRLLTRDGLYSEHACDFVAMGARLAPQHITMLKPRGRRVGVFPCVRRAAGDYGSDDGSTSSDDDDDGDGGDDGDNGDSDEFDEPDRIQATHKRRKPTAEELKLVNKRYQDESNKKIYVVVEVTYSTSYRQMVAYRKAECDTGRSGRYDLEGFDLDYTKERIEAFKRDPSGQQYKCIHPRL
jgi:hypothetical protein